MISFWCRRLFHQTWHPSFEELILYLDGEATPKADKVESHLKSCWSCRLRREKVDRVISIFMETRSASLRASPKFPPHALASFETKLDQLHSESGSPPFFSGLIRTRVQALRFYFTPLRFATFLLSLGLIVLVLMRLSSVSPVSAKEVLSHAKQEESQKVLRVPAPVIYEKLQVRRHSATRPPQIVTWEIWNDTRNSRLRQRVEDTDGLRFLPLTTHSEPAVWERSVKAGVAAASAFASSGLRERPLPPVLAELEQVFQSHRADLARPLSATNYETWRHSIPDRSEQLLRTRLNGDEVAVLKAFGTGPFEANAIVSAEFSVRMGDWHPVEQRLQIQREDGIVDYALGEVAFDVVALNALPSSIFADLAPPTPVPILQLPEPPPLHIFANVDLVPTEADLLAAEIEAWYALHSVKACLGRPISVARLGQSEIEVKGVVETEETKAHLLEALRGIPHVTSAIRTAGDDWPARSLKEADTVVISAADSVQPDTTAAPGRKLATEDLLKRYFAAANCAKGADESKTPCIQQQIAAFSRQAVSSSESAQEQAWALRQLAQRYSTLKRGELRTSTRRLLELMVQDHMNALKQGLDESRSLVEPILIPLRGEATAVSERLSRESVNPDAARGDWSAASIHLCANVDRTVSLMLSLFAETNVPVNEDEEAMRRLWSTLAGLDGELQLLATDVATQLSDTPRAMTSKSNLGQE